MNEYFKEKFYPTARHKNLAIIVPGVGGRKDFNCIIVNILPDLYMQDGGQCFPLYYYEKADSGKQRKQVMSARKPSPMPGWSCSVATMRMTASTRKTYFIMSTASCILPSTGKTMPPT